MMQLIDICCNNPVIIILSIMDCFILTLIMIGDFLNE